MNDSERRDWVENDEGLYEMWKASRMPISKFVRMYRNELDNLIQPIMEGKEKPHYLIYGDWRHS